MSKLGLALFFVTVAIALASESSHAQRQNYGKEPKFDDDGNIYVSSDSGKLIWMGTTKHCSEVHEAADQQTLGCRVLQDQQLGTLLPALKLEIYLRGGQSQTIEPGAPIIDWHFWKDGQQVAIFSGVQNGHGTYGLYDSSTARLIEKLAEPSDEALLPQWAKSQAQIQDESVPMSASLALERTKWIAKILRRIGKIEPGMRRKDLFKVFTTEGGISNRFQQTYVHAECSFIKVNVRFKAVGDEGNAAKLDPDDIIESISKPYLAWRVFD